MTGIRRMDTQCIHLWESAVMRPAAGSASLTAIIRGLGSGKEKTVFAPLLIDISKQNEAHDVLGGEQCHGN